MDELREPVFVNRYVWEELNNGIDLTEHIKDLNNSADPQNCGFKDSFYWLRRLSRLKAKQKLNSRFFGLTTSACAETDPISLPL